MNKLLSLVVVCLVLATLDFSFAATGTPVLNGVLRDQSPNTMNAGECGGNAGQANGGLGFTGTDFQLPLNSYQNNEKGLVGRECNRANGYANCGRIGADRTPVYAYSGLSPGKNIRSAQTFYHWFHNTEQTRQIDYTVRLRPTNNGAIYNYINNSFFPLDNAGWKDWCYDDNRVRHNYAYCFEIHSRIGYQGGEVFKFTGDDDVWVYIDDKLVIDLGSLHTALSATVNLDDLPFLSKNQKYRFDFFYCERHTTLSNMEITSSLAFECDYYDWCGVCEGNGMSCCTQQLLDRYCDDKDACTEDKCGVQLPPSDNGCVHIRKNCTAPDRCSVASCSKTTGQCSITPLNCDDNDPCTTDTCNPRTGCINTAKPCDDKDACTDDTCVPGVGCRFTNRTCDDSDACTDNKCNPKTGCQFTDITCNANNKCLQPNCDKRNGCSTTAVNCNDNKVCTKDSCSPTSGCINAPIVCDDNSKCTNDACVEPGGCRFTPVNCEDNNECTVDICVNSTGCQHPPRVCEERKCQISRCIPTKAGGCDYTPKDCNDNDPCTIDSCDAETGGCLNIPVKCNTTKCSIGTCRMGICDYVAVICDDNNPCTSNVCDDVSGCSFPPASCGECNTPECAACPAPEKECDDNNACTDDRCTASSCVSTLTNCPINNDKCLLPICNTTTGCGFAAKTCDDGNPCTADSCNSATGACSNTIIDKFCISCGPNACSWSDSCSPKVCNDMTRLCEEAPVICNDNNACTNDSCDGTSTTAVCINEVEPCGAPADLCHPLICNPAVGCEVSEVVCNDNNPCTTDTCQPASGNCTFTDVTCASVDNCTIAACNAVTGTCDTTPVDCDFGNLCAIYSCDPASGCKEENKVCGDGCNPAFCDETSGECVAAPPMNCSTGTQCTAGAPVCVNGALQCEFTETNFCDDGDNCTLDICDTTNSTHPCTNTNRTCDIPDQCSVIVDCSCRTAPKDCQAAFPNATDPYCYIPKCDPIAGCLLSERVCPNDDIGCFTSYCKHGNVTHPGSCVQERRSNFGSSTGKGGVLCALLYDKAAKAAAITAGAIAGIVIGAVAAAALIGFGGKKGYEYLMARNNPIGDVGNNPLYAPSAGSGESPLYGR